MCQFEGKASVSPDDRSLPAILPREHSWSRGILVRLGWARAARAAGVPSVGACPTEERHLLSFSVIFFALRRCYDSKNGARSRTIPQTKIRRGIIIVLPSSARPAPMWVCALRRQRNASFLACFAHTVRIFCLAPISPFTDTYAYTFTYIKICHACSLFF
jgi:hypothetical protein